MQLHSTDNRIDFPKLLEELSLRINSDFENYTPNVDIYVETTNFILKTAESMNELVASFRLRNDVFFGTEKSSSSSIDVDEFDPICDHLIIIDKNSNTIVGTYRINCSLYTSTFYTETEFVLDNFLKENSTKIELGRACIHENFRNGKVIDLLWKGIAEYSKKTNSKYLFGCSSIKLTSPQLAFELSEYFLERGNCDELFSIKTTPKFKMDFNNITPRTNQNTKTLIPALLRSYISAGAKVVQEPALDLDFNCIDFMTILDLENISSLYKRRYFAN